MPDMLATSAIGPSPGLSQPNLVPRLGDLLADGKWPRAYVQVLITMANDVVEWLAIQYLLRFSWRADATVAEPGDRVRRFEAKPAHAWGS